MMFLTLIDNLLRKTSIPMLIIKIDLKEKEKYILIFHGERAVKIKCRLKIITKLQILNSILNKIKSKLTRHDSIHHFHMCAKLFEYIIKLSCFFFCELLCLRYIMMSKLKTSPIAFKKSDLLIHFGKEIN